MSVSPLDRFAASPAVLFRELEGESVLLNMESGVYYGLDPVGTRVWTLLTADHPVASICEVLLGDYDVAREVLENDVLTLVTDLCEKGLVTPRQTP